MSGSKGYQESKAEVVMNAPTIPGAWNFHKQGQNDLSLPKSGNHIPNLPLG
jgi:hypothetical protein